MSKNDNSKHTPKSEGIPKNVPEPGKGQNKGQVPRMRNPPPPPPPRKKD